MKIIFLDIDGVIALPVPGRKTVRQSRECIEQLNRITNATGAKIVLTSGRRFAPDLELTLAEWGVRAEIIGRTPVVGNGLGGNRAEEIVQWLAEHASGVERFVILEDAEDVGALDARTLRTTYDEGLTEEIAVAAIAMLGC